jgi:hypothetical protein
VNPPAVCPRCESKLGHHSCSSPDCGWAECTNPECRWYGLPERGIWRRPIEAKEKR